MASSTIQTVVEVLASGVTLTTRTGTHGDDVIIGTDDWDVIEGREGNDTLVGFGFDDYLAGGKGDDVISAGAGRDVVVAGSGNDVIDDGAGDDQAEGGDGHDTFAAAAGQDGLYGGAGNDTYDASQLTSSVTVDLENGIALGVESGEDYLSNFEAAIGGSGDDHLIGNSGGNFLDGGDGNDTVEGRSGSDTLRGGAGDDVVLGYSGDDTLVDGAGADLVDGGVGSDTVRATDDGTADTFFGGSGFDTLDFSDFQSGIVLDISKGIGSDTYSGFERFIATAHDDVVKGSKRADVIEGGDGDDTLRGLGGIDRLLGGDGNDTFVFLKKDVKGDGVHLGVDAIADFSIGDTIDLRDFAKSSKFSAATDIVASETDAGTMISAKIGSEMFDVALLEGVFGASAADLLSSGAILS